MSIVTRHCTRAVTIAVAMVCLGQAAHAHAQVQAQVAPVQYWIPGGLFGFGSNWTHAGGAATYRNFPGFDARYGAQDASSDWRDNFRTGMFARSDAGNIGLNGLGLAGTASDFGGLSYQSAVSGYAFKGAGNLPSSVYVGFDRLNYRPGIGSPLAPFSTDASINAGYRARAGIAFQPTANVTLSFEASVTQQGSGDIDINSPLLPALSPFSGGRR